MWLVGRPDRTGTDFAGCRYVVMRHGIRSERLRDLVNEDHDGRSRHHGS